MRAAKVLYKDQEAGLLQQSLDGSFTFEYSDEWLNNSDNPPISLTFPKSQKKYFSKNLFPFFYHLLPEGTNKRIVCTDLKIDSNDAFGILLNTARYDTIGAIKLIRL